MVEEDDKESIEDFGKPYTNTEFHSNCLLLLPLLLLFKFQI